MRGILYGWSIIVMVAAASGDDLFGNILDVSWRLPEPQGAPRTPCERDLQSMYTNLRNLTVWAYQMWDASAGAPVGLLNGNQGGYGHWDECIRQALPEDGSLGMPRQYCLVTTYLDSFPHADYPYEVHQHGNAYNKLYRPVKHNSSNGSLSDWGVCAPASCNHTELSSLIQDHFHNESLRIFAASRQWENIWGFNDSIRHEVQARITSTIHCQKPGEIITRYYGRGTVAFTVISILLTMLVLISTSIHWYTKRTAKEGDRGSRIVKSFSIIANVKKLCYQSKADELSVLNGLRIFSIIYVTVGHQFFALTFIPSYNRYFIDELNDNIGSVFLMSGDLIVDNFFVMSGILIAHRLLKKKPGAPMNFGNLIFDRYIRLVPLYMLVILFTVSVLPLMGSGPMWALSIPKLVDDCVVNWWTNLLMVNNYVHIRNMCLGVAWYIPCEFHFFLVSLFVLWLLRKKPVLGLVSLMILFCISLLLPAFTMYTMLNDLIANNRSLADNLNMNSEIKSLYVWSHTRASPYLLGLLTGYLLIKYQKSSNKVLSMKSSISAVLVAFLVILLMMFSRYFARGFIGEEPSPISAAIYTALHRPVWALAFCVLVLCCTLGEVPFVRSFFGWYPWAPLARLVYGVYLIHVVVQALTFMTIRQAQYIDVFTVMLQGSGTLLFSFAGSFILYLFVEAPCRALAKMIVAIPFRKHKKNNKDRVQDIVTEDTNISMVLNNKDIQPE